MAETSEPSPTAAEILRPALMLWLLTWVAVGAVNHVWLLCDLVWAEPSIGMLVWLWGQDLVFAVLVVWFVRSDREARCIFRRPRPRMIELCVVVGIGASLLFNTWHGMLPDGPSPVAWEHVAGWPLLASLLTSALFPAIFEELMYRGLLLERFRRVMPQSMAIWVQAMMFAVAHLDPMLLLSHFAFGVVAGIMRMAAGALWPCILMHLLWNTWVVLTEYQVL